MSKRLLEWLKQPIVLILLAAGLVFSITDHVCYVRFMESMDFKYIHPPDDIIRWTFHIIFILAWFALAVVMIRNAIYRKRTGGRSYIVDHAKYGRTYGELSKYYENADPYRIQEETLPVEDWRDAEGVILGKVGRRLIKRPSNAVGNLSLFSLPGGGKTTSQIIPTALRFAGSVLAIDIKGDILHWTKDKRRIKVFAPDDPESSCHFNPLYGIQKMSKADRRVFLEQIAYVLVEDETDSAGKYFVEGARDFFCGIASCLLNQDINTSFTEIVRAILHGDPFTWVKTVVKGDSDDAKDYLASYMGSSEKNVSGCYNAICKAVRPYSIGSLAQLLDGEGDVITPETLERGYDVYVEIPQDRIHTYAPITTVLVQQFMTAFMRRPDAGSLSAREKAAIRPIIFLLDEFPQLNFDFKTLSAALSTLRSKSCSVFMAQQSIAQLTKRYGDEGCREIIDTCAYISVMSAQDPQSREFFSKLIGTKKVLRLGNSETGGNAFSPIGTTSRNTTETRDLIFQPEDFGNLDDHVVIIANGKYIKADKCKCYE